MRKVIVAGIVLMVLMVPLLTFSAELRFGDQPYTEKSEKITDDLYIIGGNLTSAGNASGDVVAGGGNVVVSGDVAGDIMAGGSNVTILGNVGDDVRIGGGTVVIQSKIEGDLVAGGGQLTVGGSGIGGDAILGGGNIRLDSPVEGDALIGGGNVYINAAIGGNVKIEADKVTLGKNAVIEGNLTYKAKEKITMEEGAVVRGIVDFKERGADKSDLRWAFSAAFSGFILWKFFALLFGALLFGLIFRRYSREIAAMAVKRPFFELGRGLLIFVAMPILSVLLMVTVVGIPLGIMGLLGFVILVLFGWMMAPVIVGSVVYHYYAKKGLEVSWKTILLGVLLYCLVGLVPFIGGLVQFLVVLVSLGCAIALKLRIAGEWR